MNVKTRKNKGREVMIYSKPVTKEKPEGMAVILRVPEEHSAGGMYYCLVKFKSDNYVTHRFISNEDLI